MSAFPTFLLLLLVLAAVLRVDFFFYVLYLFFGLYVLAQLWVRRAMGRLTVRRRFIDPAFLGETVDVHLDLVNRSVLPIAWLRVRETRSLRVLNLVARAPASRPGGPGHADGGVRGGPVQRPRSGAGPGGRGAAGVGGGEAGGAATSEG